MNAIEIKKLSKKYGNKVAVDNLNLNIEKGELFSLLGVNGAGKSTTIKMLTCLIAPTTGDAKLNGLSIINNSNELKKIINVSPQETAIAPNLTVKENLDFLAEIYEVQNKEEKILNLLKKFKIDKVSNQKAKTLSGGWQRRLSIAMAMINDPEILFLDEPTLGLDVIARRELWEVIREMKEKTTIILTTHYMEEAEKLSDRIGIMENGKLIDVGTPNELISKVNAKDFEDAFVSLVTGGNLK